jgi:poly(3-hydroxybutyrate) depolymerase
MTYAMLNTAFDLLREESARAQRFMALSDPPADAKPNWCTPNRPEALTDSVVLRRFGEELSATGIPALIVTPQVNHSYIADFNERQSLVRTLLGAGFTRVGVTDWCDPSRDRAYGIAESIDDILACAEALGPEVHLIGLCQGGWQTAIVAALHPDRVASLTVAAAPIDTHAGDTVLHAFTFGLPLAFFQQLVKASGGVAPGAAIARGFDLLKPFERFVFNPLALYLKLDDEGYVSRYRELRNWYRLNKDIAGDIYLEAVERLFMKNELAAGTLDVRGEIVDLSTLRCPIHLVAGTRDHITPKEQVLAFEALAPEASVTRHVVDAGHIGSFMGRQVLESTWREIGVALAGG